ncbi:MAG: PIN domain-containing protein [Thermoleophilia bacterium]|nr:PIN domain-containing protein [Thermoleophilia bacterium]
MPLYLADSSIWLGARKWRGTYLPELLGERLAADEIATCIPVALEVLTGPASAAELDEDWQAVWRHLRWLPVGESVMDRAFELLKNLARSSAGAHRRRPIDYMVAACAEAAGGDVVLWHWDRDLAVICDHARIAHEPEHERAIAAGINVEPGGRRRGSSA